MRWLLLVACLGLPACSRSVRVRAKITSADGSAVDLTKLQLRAVASCDPSVTVVEVPDAGAAPPEDSAASAPEPPLIDDAGAPLSRRARMTPRVRIDKDAAAFEIYAHVCNVALTAWLDADGDGQVGPGDWVGSVGPAMVEDRGWCAGNMNDIGPLILKRR